MTNTHTNTHTKRGDTAEALIRHRAWEIVMLLIANHNGYWIFPQFQNWLRPSWPASEAIGVSKANCALTWIALHSNEMQFCLLNSMAQRLAWRSISPAHRLAASSSLSEPSQRGSFTWFILYEHRLLPSGCWNYLLFRFLLHSTEKWPREKLLLIMRQKYPRQTLLKLYNYEKCSTEAFAIKTFSLIFTYY